MSTRAVTCLKGCLGCQWHYKEPQSNSYKLSKIIWLFVLLTTGIYVWFWFYYWLLVENSADNINWYAFNTFGRWVPAYFLLFSLTCVTFAYITFLLILVICHLAGRLVVDIHWIHRVLIVIILGMCVAVTVVLDYIWSQGWDLIALSIRITAPFLHIGGVILITFLSWFIFDDFVLLFLSSSNMSKMKQVTKLTVYVCFMILLYICPIFIHSPCVCELSSLPKKPQLLAHKGASAIAPENTLVAFQYSADSKVLAFESDVSVSYDGVPFVLHDNKLRRTTNVGQVYPDMADKAACWFNMSQLQELDAGSWFLRDDPYGTVASISESKKKLFKEQKIPTLQEMLEVAMLSNTSVMFDVKVIDNYPSECNGHPYEKRFEQQVVDVIKQLNFPDENMWWLYYKRYNSTFGFHAVEASSDMPIEILANASVSTVNFEFTTLLSNRILDYISRDIWVNIYVIDSPWLYSLSWCLGINSITTNNCHTFSEMRRPVWHLTPVHYLVIWICVDLTSLLILFNFCFFKCRKYRNLSGQTESILLVDASNIVPV